MAEARREESVDLLAELSTKDHEPPPHERTITRFQNDIALVARSPLIERRSLGGQNTTRDRLGNRMSSETVCLRYWLLPDPHLTTRFRDGFRSLKNHLVPPKAHQPRIGPGPNG